MKKGLAATAGLAFTLTILASSGAKADCCHYHWHHHWWHHYWAAPVITYVSAFWEHPYYYWSPYSVVSHTFEPPNEGWTQHVLVHRTEEIGPIFYTPVHYDVLVNP